MLRGTRSLAKREAALTLDLSEASAREAILCEFGRFASAPAAVSEKRRACLPAAKSAACVASTDCMRPHNKPSEVHPTYGR